MKILREKVDWESFAMNTGKGECHSSIMKELPRYISWSFWTTARLCQKCCRSWTRLNWAFDVVTERKDEDWVVDIVILLVKFWFSKYHCSCATINRKKKLQSRINILCRHGQSHSSQNDFKVVLKTNLKCQYHFRLFFYNKCHVKHHWEGVKAFIDDHWFDSLLIYKYLTLFSTVILGLNLNSQFSYNCQCF